MSEQSSGIRSSEYSGRSEPPHYGLRECGHCGGLLKRPWDSHGRDRDSWVHAESPQRGMATCPVYPYGFHAVPVGEQCEPGGPNPCKCTLGFAPGPWSPPPASSAGSSGRSESTRPS